MATTGFPVTSDQWTDLGATPCFLQNLSSYPVVFVVETAAPGSLNAAGHVLSPTGEMSANVGITGQKVFAKAANRPATLVVSR